MKTVRLAVVEGTAIPVRIYIKEEKGKAKKQMELNPDAQVPEEAAKNLVKAYPGRYVILKEGEKIDLAKYPVNTAVKKVELDALIGKLNSAQIESVKEFMEKLIAEGNAGGADGAEPGEPYKGWTVENLKEEIGARKDAGRDIDLPKGGKRADLARVLEQDDEDNSK